MVKEGRVSKKADEAYTTEEMLAFFDSGEEFTDWLYRKRSGRLFPMEAIESAAMMTSPQYFDNDYVDGTCFGLTKKDGHWYNCESTTQGVPEELAESVKMIATHHVAVSIALHSIILQSSQDHLTLRQQRLDTVFSPTSLNLPSLPRRITPRDAPPNRITRLLRSAVMKPTDLSHIRR